MAQVTCEIELEGMVDTVHEQWLRFEERRCAAHALTTGVRWRGEVLTFEPLGERTRVKLRVEYEPAGGAEGRLPWRLEALLQAFAAFRELETAGVREGQAG